MLIAMPMMLVDELIDNNSDIEPETQTQTQSRSRTRAFNIDQEPNDDFGNASVIQYDPSGSTHIFNASVGDSNDNRDFWRIDVNNVGTTNPDKLIVQLSFNGTNQGANGVYMNIYDAEQHQLGSTRIAVELDPVVITLIGQLTPHLYFEILSNPADNNYQYVFSVTNTTESTNPAYTNDENYANSRDIDITKGATMNNEDLDRSYDFADFYKFDAEWNQKIKLDLQISSVLQDDFDLFLFSGPSVAKKVAQSINIQQKEKIVYTSPDNRTYYARVGVKNIANEQLRDSGYYKIDFRGNIPPRWNESFQDVYIMQEDGPDLNIDLQNAFYDKNTGDQITVELWDPNAGVSGDGDWASIFDKISFKNLTVHQQIDGSIKLKLKPDKYGTEIIKVRAFDLDMDMFTYGEFNIFIKPTNDAPVLNNTEYWILGTGIYSSNGNKVICAEGINFECYVTAKDIDPWDIITFSDNTDIFDINPTTGKISFLANYNYTGINLVEITVSDNGTPVQSTSREFKFIIERADPHPKVELSEPKNESISFSLLPTFKWRQTVIDFEDSFMFYDLYLSTDKNNVIDLHKDALVGTIQDIPMYQPTVELQDKTKYYWTVVPNDGQRKGVCTSGVFNFQTNTQEPIPKVHVLYPRNNQMVDTQEVILQWSLDYAGSDRVQYEIYFDKSLEALQDPFVEFKEVSSKLNYNLPTLDFGTDYYWKIVPFTDKVRSNESQIYKFSVLKDVPFVELLTPAKNTIVLPQDTMTFNWNINYSKPGKVKNIFYLSSSPEFNDASTTKINIEFDRSYSINDLKMGTYYWKVDPYLGDLFGIESEVWVFSIKQLEVPKVILKSPIDTIYYTNDENLVVELLWQVEYFTDFEPKDMRFDIYLDDSTDEPGKMARINPGIYQQTFYSIYLPVEEGKIYYWYVVPYLQTDEGIITGICSPVVTNFSFGPGHINYGLEMELEKYEIELEAGSTKIFQFYIRNRGNIKATIDLYATTDGEAYINPVFTEKTVLIEESDSELIDLNIFVLENVEGTKFNLTIEAVIRESTVIRAEETITINIIPKPDVPTPTPSPKSLFEEYPFIWIIIVIIIFLLSMFLYTKIKRHKLLQHQRREMIFNHVKESPGDHFRGIQKALGLEVGVLAHHINKLEREEFIKSRQDGKYRRFYPMDARIDIKLILSEIQERILGWIKKNPGSSGVTIANNLGVDRKLVNYHVNVLEKGGFIYTEPKGKEKLCYSVQT
jgi:DNA-binding MarR family transcriptional regulator